MYLFRLKAHPSAEVLLGPAHLEQDFTLFFSATSENWTQTQTSFTKIRYLQISESNSEFFIGLSRSRIFTVTSPIFLGIVPYDIAVLLHSKSDCPWTFLLLLMHWFKVLPFPGLPGPAAEKRAHATNRPHCEVVSAVMGTVCRRCCSLLCACMFHNVPEKKRK